MCTDYQCISVIKAVLQQHSQPRRAAARPSITLPDSVQRVPPSVRSRRPVVPMRSDGCRRKKCACLCVIFFVSLCDVAVWLTQVRADRRARQPHAGLHSHAVCHFHSRLCIPSLPFSLCLSHFPPAERTKAPPLFAANQHVLRHSNMALRPSAVLSLSLSFCLISHPFTDALRIIEYVRPRESPCMSASVTTLLCFFFVFFFVCRALVRWGCHVVTWHGHQVIKPSQQRRKSMITSQRESNNGCPLPSVNNPYYHFITPTKSRQPLPSTGAAYSPHLFPPAFFFFFRIERR